MTENQQQNEQVLQAKAKWAKRDPVSLVHESRTALFQGLQGLTNDPDIIGPLSEIVDRFDQSIRAGMGAQLTPTT